MDRKRVQYSLGTVRWEEALETIHAKEEGLPEKQGPVAIERACDAFEQDGKAQGLAEDTVGKRRRLMSALKVFTAERGLKVITEIQVDTLRQFRASWPDKNLSASKKLERVKAFFRFCMEAGWVPANPAKLVKPPKCEDPPTMPFEKPEMQAILKAADGYATKYPKAGAGYARRLRCLILLMRYSGLAIRDAVTLNRDRLREDKLFLRRQKTGVPVMCKLPEFVARELRECPSPNPTYFFWTADGKAKTAVADWQRTLRKLFTLANLPGGHSHRFRDTFAVELLLSGIPIDRVSVLLGHSSVRTTERYYAPWVRARQEQLEKDLERSWIDDPIVAAGDARGTCAEAP